MNESPITSRRAFLSRAATGVGSIALAQLLAGEAACAAPAESLGVVDPLHVPAKAKRVIFLVMAGGPSHLETLDPKPELTRLHGKPMPESFTKGQPIAQLQGHQLKCFAPQFEFQRFGESGQEICSLFPGIGSVADRLCIIRSMRTKAINHDPAHTLMNSGSTIPGRPSMGSWINYGLGSVCDNLPGFVVLTSVGKGGQAQPIASRQWSTGALPTRFQGVEFRAHGDPVMYVSRPAGVDAPRQRDVVDAVKSLNEAHQRSVDDPEIATRLAQYEMAFRMQSSVPELMDMSDEPAEVLKMYGTEGADGTFAANCLLARRLAERGVRFVQLYHRAWDHHGGIKRAMEITAKEVDQPCAALINDLQQRGMLDDTLVVWGGEFGRTPMAQGNGRDHHIKGYSLWMAGGGIQGGMTHGATDALGYNAVEDVVEIHDLHATILHLLGIDHRKLTIRSQGLDVRLTSVFGNVVREVLA